MDRFKLKTIFILCVAIVMTACAKQNVSTSHTAENVRIVSVGGAVTETVFALGQDAKLVGTDSSSIFPEAATRLPQVGYQRQLSAEGVLSLKPNVVLAMAEAGPPNAVQQIESAGVKILRVNGENSIDGAKMKIREIAKALNVESKGEDLIIKLDADLSEAKQCADELQTRPRVLFIYARGSGTPQVSGTKTAADAMINLAGGQNAVTEFENFKPLTPESMVASAPDFILLPTRGLESIGGIEGLLKTPGVSETPAGKNRRIITVDDLVLLGFSPRMGEGLKELCGKLRQ
jgi:iron complex transport system substrate-binding protein